MYIFLPFRITQFNLLHFMKPSQYEEFWRHRIKKMRIYLLEENNKVINNYVEFGSGFFIQVNYPMTFYDRDRFGRVHLFGAHPFECRSTYLREDDFQEDCEMSEEFDIQKYIYAPSPNGTFTFTLFDDRNLLDKDKFQKMKIQLFGSRMSF